MGEDEEEMEPDVLVILFCSSTSCRCPRSNLLSGVSIPRPWRFASTETIQVNVLVTYRFLFFLKKGEGNQPIFLYDTVNYGGVAPGGAGWREEIISDQDGRRRVPGVHTRQPPVK
jgi:hypothetical protein